MKETAETVIEYAFNTLTVQAIQASLQRDNQRSIKLLEKLSFRHSHEADSTDPDVLWYLLKMTN
ncbi:Acetyltransferase (GNAT) domain-containing protein [Spirosoma endophyticum]|uniref:Acetyltransferase (GNAT) domain-containing protein n=2 Tax=Spirosoma endophyticum TaxID=662367 RepID=A0A1I2B6Z6_9BACT|nr:Acetyltransferase (GNAT) domain-containing protein [Spirosoma endophyticum]